VAYGARLERGLG